MATIYISITISPAFFRNCFLVAKSAITIIIKANVAKNTSEMYIKNKGGIKAIKRLDNKRTNTCLMFTALFIMFTCIACYCFRFIPLIVSVMQVLLFCTIFSQSFISFLVSGRNASISSNIPCLCV